jgi:hypothetical protein
MQHHPSHRPARPLAAMRPAPLRPLQQTPRMQKGLRPRVAPGKIMIAPEMLVKMLGREARVTRPVKRFHLRLPVDRNPLAGGLAQPPVEKPGIAIVRVPLAPAAERPLDLPPQAPLLPPG